MTEPTPTIPQDLNSQVQAIRAFAMTHNLLNQGQFPASHFKVVTDCIEFLKVVHGKAVVAASSHESAREVPELRQYLEQEESKDGAPEEV
jgi:hypothetical protein